MVDIRDKLETYPELPRPATVDARVVILVPPGPMAVENVERDSLIDEIRDGVDTYPTVPSPATVDVN